MKKFLGMLSLILLCIMLVGCANKGNAEKSLATQKISSALDRMIVETKKVDMPDEGQIDLSSDLGYFVEEERYINEQFTAPRRKGDEKRTNLDTPSPHKADKYMMKLSMPIRNGKRFYFISKETEDNYGDLYFMSEKCVGLVGELRQEKDNLLNNCMKSKSLVHKISESKTNISEADLKTLNSYTEVINSCSDKISKQVKCNDCVKSISNKKSNLLSNHGSMTVDYIKLANDLDNNCLSIQHADMTVEQLNYYLQKILGEDVGFAPFLSRNHRFEYNHQNDNFTNDIEDSRIEYKQYIDEQGELKKGQITSPNNRQLPPQNNNDENNIVNPEDANDNSIFTNNNIQNDNILPNEDFLRNTKSNNIEDIIPNFNTTDNNDIKNNYDKDDVDQKINEERQETFNNIDNDIITNEQSDKIREDNKVEENDEIYNDNQLNDITNEEIKNTNDEENKSKFNHDIKHIIDKEKLLKKNNEFARKEHLNEIYQKYIKPNNLHNRKVNRHHKTYTNEEIFELNRGESGLSYNLKIKEVRA